MKPLRLLLLLVVVAGCGAAERRLQDKGYSLSGQDPFRFEVDRELLREWGGFESAKFNQVLEEELERLRICGNGYVLRNEGVRDGLFRVIGRCKS